MEKEKDSNFRIIEVKGVKMEIDLRTVKKIEEYKVGDAVKVLIKEYSDFKSYIGVIIGFDNFVERPTIVIAYLKTSYGTSTIEFLYYNKETSDAEITTLNKFDIPVTQNTVNENFNRQIEAKSKEVEDLKNKQILFNELFGKYFATIQSPE